MPHVASHSRRCCVFLPKQHLEEISQEQPRRNRQERDISRLPTMCQRYLCRLLCGHLDNQYRFCVESKVRRNWDFYHPRDWKAPCDNITIDPSPARSGAWECRFPGCAFEARGRSWACCRCGSRPNTTGICCGLSDTCKHACCMTCENYVGACVSSLRYRPALRLLTCSATVGEPCSCVPLTLQPP